MLNNMNTGDADIRTQTTLDNENTLDAIKMLA